MKETWRPIPGYEETHEVSNLGRVRSLSKVICTKNGRIKNLKGRILKQYLNPKGTGYFKVWLCRGNHDNKQFSVHRLVAMAFVENPNSKPQVNHMDCNSRNNKAVNLEWVTPSEQIQHAYDNGLITLDRRGVKNSQSKITPDDVRVIRRAEKSKADLAAQFGISISQIERIQRRVMWNHVE